MTQIGSDIEQAVELLRAGELVAFPTETVYGLGADASNEQALKKIFSLKNRPENHPLIVHLADIDQVGDWVTEFGAAAETLARTFWPGPLTLILPKAHKVSPLLTGGQDTVGLRIPSHPVARQLLKKFAGGVAAPSANRFGGISPTRAAHVQNEFPAGLSLILEGGNCEVGIESTIIAISDHGLVMLRPGHITSDQILRTTGLSCSADNRQGIRVSGSLDKHYAPKTPAFLVNAAQLHETLHRKSVEGANCGVLSCTVLPEEDDSASWVHLGNRPPAYAQELYNSLRKLDQQKLDLLIVERPPIGQEWLAILDRLQRACEKT